MIRGTEYKYLKDHPQVALFFPAPRVGMSMAEVSTCRSTISAALRSGVVDGDTDPDASVASRNRPEDWNACLMSLPDRF